MRPFSTARQRPTLNAMNGNKISFPVCVNVMSIVEPLTKLLSIYTHNSQWSPRITKLNMRTPEVLSVNWNKIAPSASRVQKKKTFWSDFRILAFPILCAGTVGWMRYFHWATHVSLWLSLVCWSDLLIQQSIPQRYWYISLNTST